MPAVLYCDGCGRQYSYEQLVSHAAMAAVRGDLEVYCRECDAVRRDWNREETRMSQAAAEEFKKDSVNKKKAFFKSRIANFGVEPDVAEDIDPVVHAEATLAQKTLTSPPSGKKGLRRGRQLS